MKTVNVRYVSIHYFSSALVPEYTKENRSFYAKGRRYTFGFPLRRWRGLAVGRVPSLRSPIEGLNE